jgi:hypothetical protein
VKLWDFGGQVHRGQDLLGDVLALDEGDEAERGLALLTDDFKATTWCSRQPAQKRCAKPRPKIPHDI